MPAKRPHREDWFRCPCCGAELPSQARFCRECGASEDSGWGDEPLDSEDDFDYEEFVRREFPDQASRDPQRSAKRLVGLLLVLLIVVALLVAAFGPCR